MTSRVVLVTGVSRYLGAALAGALGADPRVARVIGIDTVPPGPVETAALGATEFVRGDTRNPMVAKVLGSAEVDTVVHLNLVETPSEVGGRGAMKDLNVIGTMQLLAACLKAPALRKLVVRSTSDIYGSTPRDPALFTEEHDPRTPKGGYARDAVEIEGYVRAFGRRRPEVVLSLLRFTSLIGPRIRTPLNRYLELPVIPTVLGFDPRLQFCYEDDAVEVLRRMALEDHAGTYNVGGSGVLLLSQVVRRMGRVSAPIPAPAATMVARAFRRAGVVDYSPEQLRYLAHGRAVDVSRLHAELGAGPRRTIDALDDLIAAGSRHRPGRQLAVAAEDAALQLLTRGRRTTGTLGA